MYVQWEYLAPNNCETSLLKCIQNNIKKTFIYPEVALHERLELESDNLLKERSWLSDRQDSPFS
jgi:hypothetical protein